MVYNPNDNEFINEGGGGKYLTLLNGRLRVAGCGGPLALAKAQDKPCCCCRVAGLKLRYAAGGGDGHQCNAAKYTCFVSSPGGEETDIGTVDLNNGNDGAEKVVELTIDDEQAQSITAGAADCCILVVRLRCDTPPGEDYGWGPGGCHADLARLRVTGKDDDDNDVIIFEGQAGEASISLNACPSNNP